MVTGIILAAGKASRMGRPKQLLLLEGKPLIYHVAYQACSSALDEMIAITGAYDNEVRNVLKEFPIKIVYNEEWHTGQASSVKKGIEAVNTKEQGVLFLMADQPLITTSLINELIQAYYQEQASIIVPRSNGNNGNPVLFDMKVWLADFLHLTGDKGGREIIAEHREAIHYVEVADENILFDIDTPQDYRKIRHFF